jgi:endonuclease/exonuclease/phosphatase family metal-dependent hydrolase
MGDFNFNPTTEQYRQTVAALEDAWEISAERMVETGAPDPARRIDHIFVSPDVRVASARYLPRGLSDHPAMFAEIMW